MSKVDLTRARVIEFDLKGESVECLMKRFEPSDTKFWGIKSDDDGEGMQRDFYIITGSELFYGAYSIRDPFEPVNWAEDGEAYRCSHEHQLAVTAARSARFEFGESGAN